MITTLIFDWGGVLTIGKYTTSILEVLSKEKLISSAEIYSDFDKLIIQMNEGTISFKEFARLITHKFNLKISEEEMKDIFKRAIVPNEKIIEFIKKLHSKYRLVMLSNNDEVTVKNLEEHHNDMLNLFDKKYFSHELKMRKPNLKFFRYVLDDLNTSPSECVFIDDKQKNVDGAKECGMKGIVFSSVNQLKKELVNLGVNQF